MLSKKVTLKDSIVKSDSQEGLSPTYSLRYFAESIPKYEIPKEGMPANAAYQLIHDELNLDGNCAFDLGSFTTTWMEPEAEKLITENLNKNFIDRFEYQQTTEIHQRIVNILGRLYNAPEQAEFCGTATIGSSEAIELGLLAHKWTWRLNRIKQGKSISNPNIVFSAAAHVCWDKFAKYFDVEPRIVPMEKSKYVIDAQSLKGLVDENTICVGAIMGTTYTGACESVKAIDSYLSEVKEKEGWDIPIHVDAASGGFILPFTAPQLEWDFRLSHVRSINVSGHKFGLVYPGLGWLIFKNQSDLPEELIFKVNYLGDTMPTYTLNFSRGSDTILAQYYNLLRLGHSGYEKIMNNCMENSKYLSDSLVKSQKFELLSTSELPIIVFKFANKVKFTPFELSQKLRERDWMLPAYKLPVTDSDITVMRVVVRETFSRDMAENLFTDILNAYTQLEKGEKVSLEIQKQPRQGFHII